jgi:hypothetical protein
MDKWIRKIRNEQSMRVIIRYENFASKTCRYEREMLKSYSKTAEGERNQRMVIKS